MRRKVMVDDHEDHQEGQPSAEAPADQFLFDRKQRLFRAVSQLFMKFGMGHDFVLQAASGGLMPAKNSHEISNPTQITKPNRLTK